MDLDTFLDLKETERMERERVSGLTEVEKAIEGKGGEVLAVAFVVRKEEGGVVPVVRQLFGKRRSDPEGYVSESADPGNYLVGSLMPREGYGIHQSRRENRFCIRVTDNGLFAHGDGVSQMRSIREIEAALAEREQEHQGGNREAL